MSLRRTRFTNMVTKPLDRVQRRVYAFILDMEIVYIGSSYCTLETLGYNHRNALTKYPNEVENQIGFRKKLAVDKELQKGTFKTLLEIEGITQPEIEDLEGQLIRAFTPMYNKDMYPKEKSIKKRRYD